jgi:dTDP-4-amino-4,6-dideoxygalactose transaminase
MIPITKVDVTDSEALVLEVLRSGNLAQGPRVAELESGFSELLNVKHTVAVNNGTTALVAAIQAMRFSEGDEIVTSPFTFVATLNAALEAGLTVRFADITLDDFCVDPIAIESAITDRTRAIMPVHLYGQGADMLPITALAKRFGLRIIEDAAQAHGATVENASVGSFDVGCFSLYATKNLTSGEGGLITTNDDEIADRLRVLRNQGMRQRYQYEVPGHNYRMTDLQAAVAIPQLARVDEIIEKRSKNARRLIAGLADIEGLKIPTVASGRTHVWHQFTVLIDPSCGCDRDTFVAKMLERGVTCGVYYPKLVFDYDCFRADPRVIVDDFPRASYAAANCVSLPVHQYLTTSEVDQIIDTARGVLVAG